MASFEEVQLSVRAEFPEFKLVKKSDSSFMKLLGFLLKLITLWQQDQFMTAFVTTVGTTVYTPAQWYDWNDFNRAVILRHERVHMRQKQRYGVFYLISYLLLPVPAVFAYYRTKFEMEAYAESMRAVHENGGDLYNVEFKNRMIRHFTSAEYFWAWPFRKKIERWYDDTRERIHSGSSS